MGDERAALWGVTLNCGYPFPDRLGLQTQLIALEREEAGEEMRAAILEVIDAYAMAGGLAVAIRDAARELSAKL